jgi:hypothetical protein
VWRRKTGMMLPELTANAIMIANSNYLRAA